MSLLPLLIDCSDSDLSAESLIRTVVVTDSGGNPAVACTLTEDTGFRTLNCNDPYIGLAEILRSIVLSDGTINFCYTAC